MQNLLTAPSQEFIPISTLTLNCNMEISVDVFLKVDATAAPKLFCSREMKIEPSRLHQLLDAGISKLFIRGESYQDYQAHLRSNWKALLAVGENFGTSSATILSDVVRAVLHEQFNSEDTNEVVETCKELAVAIVDTLTDRPLIVSELNDVMCHDYATFTHSTNVACFAAMLSKGLGYNDDDLRQIVAGALLHDLGKLEISDRILSKPGKLDELEFREIQKHPTYGMQRLVKEQKTLSHGQLMMVYQHHEKLDGSGYPVGILADEIHPWAKLCAVVDIFEALTSHRPYRKPMSHGTAVSILQRSSGTELDPEIVRCWKTLVETN